MKTSIRIVIAALFSFLALTSTAFAMTWNVPGDHPTIQAAITASTFGDVIVVAPGTYFEHLVFGPSKSGVRLTSSSGAAVTILDGSLNGIAVTMSGCGPATELRGFTIQHGGTLGSIGGAMRFSGSSPVVAENIIKDNLTATAIIYLDNGSNPLVTHNTITDNEARFGSGGAIYCDHFSSPIIEYNVIARNRTAAFGGGITVWEGSAPIIRHNTIVSNQASLSGAGLYVTRGSGATCQNNIIAFNGPGGGVVVDPTALGASFNCDDVFGNLSFDFQGISSPVGANGVISLDPLFCNLPNGDYTISTSSPAAPVQSPTCGLRGALDPACAVTPTKRTTWGSLKARYR